MRCRAHICSGLVCLREKILIMQTFWFFPCLHENDYFREFAKSLIVWICVCHSYLAFFWLSDLSCCFGFHLHYYIVAFASLFCFVLLWARYESTYDAPGFRTQKVDSMGAELSSFTLFYFVSKNELGTEIPIMLPPSGEKLIGWGRKPLSLLRWFVSFCLPLPCPMANSF